MIKAGPAESRPSKGHAVVVRASGQLEDGTAVDVHDELAFTIGDSEVQPVAPCTLIVRKLLQCTYCIYQGESEVFSYVNFLLLELR